MRIIELGDTEAPATGRMPPYISFQTFLNFLQGLKDDGVPPQIDRSVMQKMSGGLQSQLKVALRSLGLSDEDRPTEDLQTLVDAVETPDFERVLLRLLERTYPNVFELDLKTATPAMFADVFKQTGAKEDVARKARTFFLHAAKRAGVELGPRLANASFPKPPGGSRRKSKMRAIPSELPLQSEKGASVSPRSMPLSDKALEYKLVDLMKEEAIGAEERQAIWVLIQYLTKKTKAAD